MSSNIKVGIKNPPDGRDAIHIAVIPVTLGDTKQAYGPYYHPGLGVRLLTGTKDTVIPAEYGESDGIIDPFISTSINLEVGDRVYLWLHPNTITGLRHQWEHPKFDKPLEPMSEAELWLRQFADRLGINYNDMVRVANHPCNDEDFWENYIVAHGHDIHCAADLGEDYQLFWENMEKMMGKSFDSDHREKVGWSCSC